MEFRRFTTQAILIPAMIIRRARTILETNGYTVTHNDAA